MGNSNRLILVAALSGLFLVGCTHTGSRYHITCWSSGTKMYEGEGTNVRDNVGTTTFTDEDGQEVIVDGNCLIEQNIDRSKLK